MVDIPKRFFISEVANLVGVHPNTLKAWESASLIPKAHRTEGLIRKRWWTEEEVQTIWAYRQANYKW